MPYLRRRSKCGTRFNAYVACAAQSPQTLIAGLTNDQLMAPLNIKVEKHETAFAADVRDDPVLLGLNLKRS